MPLDICCNFWTLSWLLDKNHLFVLGGCPFPFNEYNELRKEQPLGSACGFHLNAIYIFITVNSFAKYINAMLNSILPSPIKGPKLIFMYKILVFTQRLYYTVCYVY